MEYEPYDVDNLEEIVIFEGTNPNEVIELSREGKYINLIKYGEEDKRYFRYNLQTEEFERINFYKTVPDKTTVVDVANITYWFSRARLITKDIHFGRLVVFAKNCYEFDRYSSPVRFVQQLGHPYIKNLEQWEALGVVIQDVEEFFGDKLVHTSYYDGSLVDNRKKIYEDKYVCRHNIYITYSPSDCSKEVLDFIKNRHTVSINDLDEIVGYYNDGEFYIHKQLSDLESTSEFEGIFTYKQSRWRGGEYINILDSDDYTARQIKHRVFEAIKNYSLEPEAFCRWIKKQQNIDKNDIEYLFEGNHYLDYLRCEYELKNGYKSKMVKYPDNFRTEFHKAQVEFEAEKGNFDEFKFSLQREHHKDLEHVGRKFCMIIPEHSDEIKNEANCLHHCVRTYIQPMTDGQTLIMFLRDKKAKDEPLITVEVKNGSVRQAYGDHDSKPKKEHLEYLRNWASKKNLRMACWR